VRVLAITPIVVSEEELARRQARYDRLSPAGVSIVLENLGDGPRALETAADIEASEEALLARFAAADASQYDAFLPDCVLDPVVDHADRLPLPVYGIARLAAHFLAGLGLRTGAVARNGAIAAELDRKLVSYGVAPVRPTAVIDLTVEQIADDATWAAAVQRTVADLDCDAVINGCSAVEVKQSDGRVLVDPTATALQMMATLQRVAP
jgi:Asp/Glu/hydantoin racemase